MGLLGRDGAWIIKDEDYMLNALKQYQIWQRFQG
jgi:hypothetical protein